jgi:hypothetical protein
MSYQDSIDAARDRMLNPRRALDGAEEMPIVRYDPKRPHKPTDDSSPGGISAESLEREAKHKDAYSKLNAALSAYKANPSEENKRRKQAAEEAYSVARHDHLYRGHV